MAEFRCRNLNKTYPSGNFKEVDLSFTVPHGSCLSIIGPSGSGKTTLLRGIAGLLPLDSGTIEVGGEDVSNLPPSKRHMAMIFQDAALFEHVRVSDNITYGLHALGFTKAEIQSKLDVVAKQLKIEGLLRRYPCSLSAGEAQRVGIARALIRSPQVLLLDEPLSNLDARLKEELREELLRIRKELGMTMIMVTHDQLDAITMSDTVLVMNQGRMVSLGPIETLYAHPDHLFTATFLGIHETNVFEGLMEKGSLHVLGTSFSQTKPIRDGKVLVTLRQEGIHVSKEGSVKAICTRCVKLDDRYSILAMQGSTRIRFLSNTAIPVDTVVQLQVDEEAIQIFDPQRDENLKL